MKNTILRIGLLVVVLGPLATQAVAQVFQSLGAAGNVDVNYVTGKLFQDEQQRRVFAVKILCGRVGASADPTFPFVGSELLTPGE